MEFVMKSLVTKVLGGRDNHYTTETATNES